MEWLIFAATKLLLKIQYERMVGKACCERRKDPVFSSHLMKQGKAGIVLPCYLGNYGAQGMVISHNFIRNMCMEWVQQYWDAVSCEVIFTFPTIVDSSQE